MHFCQFYLYKYNIYKTVLKFFFFGSLGRERGKGKEFSLMQISAIHSVPSTRQTSPPPPHTGPPVRLNRPTAPITLTLFHLPYTYLVYSFVRLYCRRPEEWQPLPSCIHFSTFWFYLRNHSLFQRLATLVWLEWLRLSTNECVCVCVSVLSHDYVYVCKGWNDSPGLLDHKG